MAQSRSKDPSFIKRHKTALQTVALVLILVLPFVLYVLAQGGQSTAVVVLILLMAFIMAGIIFIS